jgi:hypothetical protein
LLPQKTALFDEEVNSIFQVPVDLAGRSAPLGHWKDSILERQESSSHSVNKTLWIVRENMVTLVAMAD